MLLIGITGQARSGKDTVANMIFNELGSNIWKPATFAAPMKAMLNVIGVDCSSDADREAVLPDYGVSTRHMMQTIGTDWGRNCIGADMWVNAFCRINAGEKCVVSDVRFENEAALVRANGILIHVIGRGGISGSHVSESGVAILDSDIVLDNSGTMGDLQAQINMWDFSQLACDMENAALLSSMEEARPKAYLASARTAPWTIDKAKVWSR